MAHLGLSQWERAKGDMREAWRNDRGMTLDPKKFSPRVIQLYEQTRRESVPPPPAATPKATPETTAAAKPVGQKKGHSLLLPVLIGGAVAAGVGIAVAGGKSSGTPTPTPTPTGSVTTVLRLDGQHGGTVPCHGGLSFTIEVSNTTPQVVQINSFDLSLQTVSAGCASQVPPVNGSLFSPRELGAGTSAEIRRFDLAGQVCSPPFGAVGCTWHAYLTVSTSRGEARDDLVFATVE
jgi:hypothetical protein